MIDSNRIRGFCGTEPHWRLVCNRPRARYVAHIAQQKRDQTLSRAHMGIACSEKELKTMVETVKKLLGQGQSLESIWITHGKEFPVGVRTFYNYIEKGVMGLTNLDLPKKVRYIPRKKKTTNEPKMKLDNHTYTDWLALTEEERLLTVQIDCVEGRRKDKQCILSLHFPRLFFQLYVLLSDKTQASVQKALIRHLKIGHITMKRCRRYFYSFYLLHLSLTNTRDN